MQLPKGVRLGPWVKDMDFEQPYNIKWLQRNSSLLIRDDEGWKIFTGELLLVMAGTPSSLNWALEKAKLWRLAVPAYNDRDRR